MGRGALIRSQLKAALPTKRVSYIVLILYSLIAAATTVIGMRVVRTKWYYSGTWEENYFEGLQLIDALWFVLLAIGLGTLTLILLVAIRFLLERIPLRGEACNPALVFCASWVLIFICWVPYFLVNFPGALYADSIVIIKQALGINTLSSHHPIAYVGLIGAFLRIGKSFFDSYIMGIALYTAFQMVFMSGAFAYSVAWLARRRVPLPALIVIVAAFSILSIFPLHAVSMWKDGLYAAFILLLSLLLFDIVASKGSVLDQASSLVGIFVWGSAICLIRSNGIYVMACVWCVLLVLYARRHWKVLAPIAESILVFWLVVGPVSALLDVRTEPVESYGIPLQQVAAVVVYDGNMTSDQEEFLNTLLPLEDYAEEYIPCSVDGIKWADNFDEEFFNEHQVEFMQYWAALGKDNPGLYARAYIMESYEYWTFSNINRNFTFNGVNDKYDAPDLGIIETNLLEVWFGSVAVGWFPFKFLHLQEGAMSWIVLFCGLMLFVAWQQRWVPTWYKQLRQAIVRPQDETFVRLEQRKAHGTLSAMHAQPPLPFAYTWWVVLVPVIANWLTVLISSPFAALPRYILPAYFMLPFLLLLPWAICSVEPVHILRRVE